MKIVTEAAVVLTVPFNKKKLCHHVLFLVVVCIFNQKLFPNSNIFVRHRDLSMMQENVSY